MDADTNTIMNSNTNMNTLQVTRHSIATVLTGTLAGISLVIAEAAFSPAHATQQLFCTGRMNNDWSYTAEFLDGRFTQIRWERSGQPPQVSTLNFDSTNFQGQPVYRGTLMSAVAVTLIDLSKGNVQSGSEISVGVEEWGWSRGTCGLSSSGGGSGTSMPVATVRQNLTGVEQAQARDWLRQNNFFFTQTIEHTDTRVVERWNINTAQAINIIIIDGIVSDVVEAQ